MTASSGADKVVSQAGQTLAPLSCGFVSCRDDAQEIQNIWLAFQSSISELSGSGIQFHGLPASCYSRSKLQLCTTAKVIAAKRESIHFGECVPFEGSRDG